MYDELTAADIRLIEDKILYLNNEYAPKLREEVQRTRAFGDTSENFEYKSAKRLLNQTNSKIDYLKKVVDTAKIIEVKKIKDVVCLYDKVTLHIEDKNRDMEVVFVTTVRQDSLKRIISKESPMGKACLYHKKGEKVYVKVNETNGYYCVIKDIVPGEESDSFELTIN